MLVQGPQAVESTEPPEHGPQRGRHAGLVDILVEPPHHRELQERQGQAAAAVHLKSEHGTEPETPVSRQPRLRSRLRSRLAVSSGRNLGNAGEGLGFRMVTAGNVGRRGATA